jgi:hypothetical protein
MRNTSTPRVEATTIAAMVPRDMCDEEPEMGFTLVEQLEFRGMNEIIRYNALTIATMQL